MISLSQLKKVKEYNKEIIKLKRWLRIIENDAGGFVNVAFLKRNGLIKARYRKTQSGKSIFNKFILTEKGKKILATNV